MFTKTIRVIGAFSVVAASLSVVPVHAQEKNSPLSNLTTKVNDMPMTCKADGQAMECHWN